MGCGLLACTSGNFDVAQGTAGPDDTGITGDATVGTDTAAGSDVASDADDSAISDAPATKDDVCSRLADATCTKTTADCCASGSIAYDAAKCRERVIASCTASLAAVAAGKLTFDGTAFPACALAEHKIFHTCYLPNLEIVSIAPPCSQLFNGTVAPGGPCATSGECKASLGTVPSCDATKHCTTLEIVADGAACSTTATSEIRLCDYGSYCDSTTSKCVHGKPISEACSGELDPTCGIGNRCADGFCGAGLGVGAACKSYVECASITCSDTGTCTDPTIKAATAGSCGS
jgi:hypothetical protein